MNFNFHLQSLQLVKLWISMYEKTLLKLNEQFRKIKKAKYNYIYFNIFITSVQKYTFINEFQFPAYKDCKIIANWIIERNFKNRICIFHF